MLLHRVFLYDPHAAVGESGHPEFIYHPQGRGRWDNPHLYEAVYLSTSAEGAVGETFGNLVDWQPDMFSHSSPHLRRAMATFSVADDISLFDFDDPANLKRIAMRPSRVIVRNETYTQLTAEDLFKDRRHDGSQAWAGVRWWSFHRPTWANVMVWQTTVRASPLRLERVDRLDLSSAAVVDAAHNLSKRILP